MKTSVEYGLQGQFKVDVYNQSGELIDTTDYFDNFITQTGLSYPYDYNFSDCFRFLSLGNGTTPNTMLTTGLRGAASVIIAKNIDTNISEYQQLHYLDHSHLDVKSAASAGSCGTRVGADGPAMYRGWIIPTGENMFMADTFSINEFAVYPSSGNDPTGKYAFSRVVRGVTLPSGTKTIVTYMLNVKIKNTGAHYFNSGTFNTGNAEVSEQKHLVKSFGDLSGYYRQVYHGLRCVDNQGRTFIPKYGDPMEPSNIKLNQLAIYFSPDNSQFDSNVKGGAAFSVDHSYATDGLYALSFNHDLDVDANVPDEQIYNNKALVPSAEPQNDSTSPFKLTKDIRLKPASSTERPPRLSNYLKTPTNTINLNESNYDYLVEGGGDTSVSMATYGHQLLQPNQFDKGFITSFSSMMSNLGVQYHDTTGRRRKLTRKGFITPINALGHNTRFGSLVYAYRNGSSYYPAVDCLFYDSSGRSVMAHYREFSGVKFSERGKAIINCTLSTEPRTYGGFHVRGVQGPIVFEADNGKSFITGHSGFYEGTTVEMEGNYGTVTVEVPPLATRAYDTLSSGQNLPKPCSGGTEPDSTIQADCEEAGGTWAPYIVPGFTGGDGLAGGFGIVNVNGAGYYGVGAVQGYFTPATKDYGIVDHHFNACPCINASRGYPEYTNQADCVANAECVGFPDKTQGECAGAGGTWTNHTWDDTSVLTKPAKTDPIYWPNMEGSEVTFKVRDLKYYHHGIGVVSDPAGFFTANSQMVSDIAFVSTTPMDSCQGDASTPVTNDFLTLSSVTQNAWSSTCQAGFIVSKATGDVTNGDYDGSQIDATTNTNILKDNLINLSNLTIGTDKITGSALTGYLVPVNASNQANIVNTSWKGTPAAWSALTDKVPFPVSMKEEEVYLGMLDSSHLFDFATVDKIFDGFGEFPAQGTNFGARLSGHSTGPFKSTDGTLWQPVFTGYSVRCTEEEHETKAACEGANPAGTWEVDPLYLMALRANHEGGDVDATPSCELNGVVSMTDFLPPEGQFIHYESYRLLPNFASGQANSDAYFREDIHQGGAYPGMSSLNTMEVYLDITWSAPCGDVESDPNADGICVEYPA